MDVKALSSDSEELEELKAKYSALSSSFEELQSRYAALESQIEIRANRAVREALAAQAGPPLAAEATAGISTTRSYHLAPTGQTFEQLPIEIVGFIIEFVATMDSTIAELDAEDRAHDSPYSGSRDFAALRSLSRTSKGLQELVERARWRVVRVKGLDHVLSLATAPKSCAEHIRSIIWFDQDNHKYQPGPWELDYPVEHFADNVLPILPNLTEAGLNVDTDLVHDWAGFRDRNKGKIKACTPTCILLGQVLAQVLLRAKGLKSLVLSASALAAVYRYSKLFEGQPQQDLDLRSLTHLQIFGQGGRMQGDDQPYTSVMGFAQSTLGTLPALQSFRIEGCYISDTQHCNFDCLESSLCNAPALPISIFDLDTSFPYITSLSIEYQGVLQSCEGGLWTKKDRGERVAVLMVVWNEMLKSVPRLCSLQVAISGFRSKNKFGRRLAYLPRLFSRISFPPSMHTMHLHCLADKSKNRDPKMVDAVEPANVLSALSDCSSLRHLRCTGSPGYGALVPQQLPQKLTSFQLCLEWDKELCQGDYTDVHTSIDELVRLKESLERSLYPRSLRQISLDRYITEYLTGSGAFEHLGEQLNAPAVADFLESIVDLNEECKKRHISLTGGPSAKLVTRENLNTLWRRLIPVLKSQR